MLHSKSQITSRQSDKLHRNIDATEASRISQTTALQVQCYVWGRREGGGLGRDGNFCLSCNWRCQPLWWNMQILHVSLLLRFLRFRQRSTAFWRWWWASALHFARTLSHLPNPEASTSGTWSKETIIRPRRIGNAYGSLNCWSMVAGCHQVNGTRHSRNACNPITPQILRDGRRESQRFWRKSQAGLLT